MSLVFPQTHHAFKGDRAEIRAQQKDTYNRLHSIAEDAAWIENEVQSAFSDFPVVANQRAGSWYVNHSSQHAYFKSTDGHAGQHDFNLRRANLQLLALLSSAKGMILVDSTRRGKRFPDALSKTIPIWCAVLNKARMNLLPPNESNSDVKLNGWVLDGKLWTLPTAVGRSEHAQMESNIDRWAKNLTNSSYNLDPLLALRKPLRPIFISPASQLSHSPASTFGDYIPIVCASASKLASEQDGMERTRGFTYVQGSGDDHEAWSKGLTAATFWLTHETIITASREDIDQVIEGIVSKSKTPQTLQEDSCEPRFIQGTGVSAIFASDSALSYSSPRIELHLGPPPPAGSSTIPPDGGDSARSIQIKGGKASYNAFFSSVRDVLPWLAEKYSEKGRMMIVVRNEGNRSDAKDYGVALLLILLVRYFDDGGSMKTSDHSDPAVVSKALIRRRLEWILQVFPEVNPSRGILNRVNEFLISSSLQ